MTKKNMKTTSNSPVILGGVGIIALVIIIFMYSRIAPYFTGPRIVSINIEPVMYVDEYSVSIEAEIEHATEVRINGGITPLNEEGELAYILALSPGENIITFEVLDEFDHTKTYTYTVVTPNSETFYPSLYTQEEETELLEESSDELSEPLAE